MQERTDIGDGFEARTSAGTDELVLRLRPEFAHEVGEFLWKSFARDLYVDDPRVIFAAALCNLSEFMLEQRRNGEASLAASSAIAEAAERTRRSL